MSSRSVDPTQRTCGASVDTHSDTLGFFDGRYIYIKVRFSGPGKQEAYHKQDRQVDNPSTLATQLDLLTGCEWSMMYVRGGENRTGNVFVHLLLRVLIPERRA